jgi:hypothetical protein
VNSIKIKYQKPKVNYCFKNIVAYLLHERTVEPQEQPLLSNTRTQQQSRRVTFLGNSSVSNFPASARDSKRESTAKQRRGKRASSTVQTVFSVGPVQNGYKRSEFRSEELLRIQGREWSMY